MVTAYDRLINVIITQPGMQNYTGNLRRHLFKDGRSVEKIPVRMALLLGASMSITDEDGNILNPNTYKFDQVGEVSAGDSPTVILARQSDIDEAAIALVEAEAGAELSDAPMSEDDLVGFSEPGEELLEPRIWSLQELEAIADAEGIAGLREVGDILEVKGRSIGDLIQNILVKQTSEPSSDSDKE